MKDPLRTTVRPPMKVSIPDSVLSTELHDEGVLLNLETGEYFGLDEVGMEMWKVLRAALLEQYDVAEDVLAKDLDELIAKLAERKLLLVADE